MTYKETLFFIAKSLTISLNEENKEKIENQLKTTEVDWDGVVRISTGHFVFPALYCNLKRANFLHYLPEELVNYMIHITDLNRERNQQIIDQAKEINELLIKNNITPIFLKGTGNLLEGLYEDIGERMVGDIDFLVSTKEFTESVRLLKEDTYTEYHKNKPDSTLTNRHYPKMIKTNQIASIEVHYRMVSSKLFSNFNHSFISKNKIMTNNFFTLSSSDNVIMTSINKQVNDSGNTYKTFGLRNSYDLFLLSKKTNTKEAIIKTENKEILNNFLYSTYMLFNRPTSIQFINNENSKTFYKKQLKLLKNPNTLKYKLLKIWVPLSHRLSVIIKSIFSKKYRNYLWSRIKPNS